MNATYIDELNNRASKKQTSVQLPGVREFEKKYLNNSSTTPSSRYATPLTQDKYNSARKAAVPKKTTDERQLMVLRSVERLGGASTGKQCDLRKKIPNN